MTILEYINKGYYCGCKFDDQQRKSSSTFANQGAAGKRQPIVNSMEYADTLMHNVQETVCWIPKKSWDILFASKVFFLWPSGHLPHIMQFRSIWHRRSVRWRYSLPAISTANKWLRIVKSEFFSFQTLRLGSVKSEDVSFTVLAISITVMSIFK